MSTDRIILAVIAIAIMVVLIFFGVFKTIESEKSSHPVGGEAVTSSVSEQTNTGKQESEVPAWQSPEQPTQSTPLKKSEIPEQAIKISITANGITPASFEVKASSEVMLSVSSADQWTHIFKFKNQNLAQVAVGLSPNETRAITFFAPSQKGEYEYYCDVPGHESRGEKGKMVVR